MDLIGEKNMKGTIISITNVITVEILRNHSGI
jgi:hypothetical protein